MSRARKKRPAKPGRKPSVPDGHPTLAEQALLQTAECLHAASGAWPTSAAIAREAGWTRQRAHALVLRCEAKRLVRRRGGAVEVRA